MVVQSGQAIDLESAREFMRQILAQITTGEMTAMALELQQKCMRLQAFLAPGALEDLGEQGCRSLLERCFATKRHVAALLRLTPAPDLTRLLRELLYGEEEQAIRLERFCSEVTATGDAWAQVAPDLASECLYLVHPDRAWLWTRWLWEPRAGVGSLRLVTQESVDLRGRGLADTYQRVGDAVRWVRELGRSEGLWPDSAGQFGADVFLACVYVVYMYTVLRMRMTREFNQVIPRLPEMTRRLLGTHRTGGEGTSHG